MELQLFNGKYNGPEAVALIRSICKVAIAHHERMIVNDSEEDSFMREKQISYLQDKMQEMVRISFDEKETFLQTTLKVEA